MIIGALAALAGARIFDFFPQSRGMPLQFAILLFLAVLLVSSAGSPLADLEAMESGTLFRAQLLHLATGFIVGALITLTVSVISAQLSSA